MSMLRSLETLDLEDNELGEAEAPACGFADGVSTLARLQCLNIAQCAPQAEAGCRLAGLQAVSRAPAASVGVRAHARTGARRARGVRSRGAAQRRGELQSPGGRP